MPTGPSIFLATHALFFASSVVASLVVYLWSRPSRLEILGTLAGGILLALRFGLIGSPYVRVMVFLCYWGACALTIAFFAAWLPGASGKKRTTTLVIMWAPPLLEILAAVALALINRLVPETLDYYLYAFDFSLGYPPGLLAGSLLVKMNWLRIMTECAYMNLTLAMTASYLFHRTYSPDKGRSFLRLIVLVGILGMVFYVAFPGVGTDVLLSGKLDAPDIKSIGVTQAPSQGEPRNCMPSLHTAWALAIWWTFPKKHRLRPALGTYVFLVLLYTLACGHYAVDLIAAVPFTLAIYACANPAGPRYQIFAVSASLFFGCLVLIRYFTHELLLFPMLPWAFSTAMLAGCQILRHRVDTVQGAGVKLSGNLAGLGVEY